MNYMDEILSLLKQMDNDKLKCIYLFLKGILD